MIELSEQHGYKKPGSIQDIEKYLAALKNRSYSKSIQRGEQKAYCFNILPTNDDTNPYHFETSYFVGVDWIVENELPIYVKPKLDNKDSEVDYVKMLFEALKAPENFPHLEHLCEIDFERPTIAIKQNQDLLTPLLLIRYISLLKKIVQKGLKKSYYPVTKNLNAKTKGKILINETIKKNHFNHKMLFNVCEYSEFGINSIENKILKKALTFSIAAMQNLKGVDMSPLNGLVNYIQPAFIHVDHQVNVEEMKHIKPNKLYKEYEQALIFARHILKRYGYNISTTHSTDVHTPPFWIDMSKLFELYVFSKLKERFLHHQEVKYHKFFNYLQPDFILKSKDGLYKMVVDAKYKPRYQDGNISTEDIRQLSGYARLNDVYDYLEIEKDQAIDCLIIYSNQNAGRVDFKNVDFKQKVEQAYNRFYKIGIELPVKNNKP